jgi:hypothetical protein
MDLEPIRTAAAREPFLRLRRANGAWVADGQHVAAFDVDEPQRDPDPVTAGWRWDGTTLVAKNDRYGLLPLFYFERNDGLGISTSIPQLLAHGAPAEFDLEAMSVFLRLGCFLDTDTPFLGIRALPPSATLRWSAGRLELASTPVARNTLNLTRSQAIDGYIELFRESICRRSPGDAEFAVPLSGGRDSRHVLFELLRQGHRPKVCPTTRYFPPGDTGDAEIATAARVANTVGVLHRVVGPVDRRMTAELKCFARTSFCAIDAAWLAGVPAALQGEVDLVYDGIAGDVLSAGLFLTPQRLEYFRSGFLDRLAEDLMPSEPNMAMLYPASRPGLQRAVAIERLTRELRRHDGAPNPVGSFIFWNRTRRHIAACSTWILAASGHVRTPYLDRDLFDFLAALPAEVFMDHAFHTETIARAYPEYAAVPYSAKGADSRRDDEAAAVRTYVADLLKSTGGWNCPGIARRAYFWPRLARCAVDPSYRQAINWLGPQFVYLISLAAAAAGR